MNFGEAKDLILKNLESKSLLTNIDMINILKGNKGLFEEVRQNLILNDFAKDKDGVGLIFLNVTDISETSGKAIEDVGYVKDYEDCEFSAPHHIFISYGRNDATNIATKIYNDLKLWDKTAEVWMDPNLKVGIWYEKIANKIEKCDVFLALMSPYSLRRESVCGMEVNYAHNEKKAIIPILICSRPDVKPSLLLCGRNWIDFSEDYETAMDTLKKYISCNDSTVKTPFHPKITGKKPLDFGPEIARYSLDFKGRDWIDKEIENWLKNENKRSFVIIGNPGSGKSSIVSNLSQKMNNHVLGIHFCTIKKPRSLEPKEFVESLVVQLYSQLDEYADLVDKKRLELVVDAATAFREWIVEPTQSMQSKPLGSYIIIVDALDEALRYGRDNIADIIFSQINDLPNWLRIIITTRPEDEILDKIGTNFTSLYLSNFKSKNHEDIKEYIKYKFEQPNFKELFSKHKENHDEIIEIIADRADETFLYAKFAIIALESGEIDPKYPDSFPRDMIGFYQNYFENKYPNLASYKELRKILEILLAAKEPLNSHELSKFMDKDHIDIENIMVRVSSIFPKIERRKYQAFHPSIIEWLTGDVGINPRYKISLDKGLKALCEDCWNEFLIDVNSMSEYALLYLPVHLLQLKRYEDLSILLCNPEFFIRSWENDLYTINLSWSELEKKSDIRIIDTYKDIITSPSDYKEDFILYLGRFLNDVSYYEESISLYNYLIEYFIKRGDENKIQYVLSELFWTRYLYSQVNHDDLKSYYESYLKLLKLQERICKNTNNKMGLLKCYGYQANLYEDNLDYNRAIYLYHEQQLLCRELGNNYWLQISVGNEGQLNMRLGHFDKSITQFKEKETICKNENIYQGLQFAYNYQGFYYLFVEKDEDKALNLFMSQYELARKINYHRGVILALEHMIYIFNKKEDHAKVKVFSSELEELKTSIKEDYQISINHENKNLFKIALKFYEDEYLRLLQEQEIIFENNESFDKKRNINSEILKNLEMQSSFMESIDTDKALDLYKQIENICKNSMGNQRIRNNAIRNQWWLLYKINDLNAAMEIMKDHHDIFSDNPKTDFSLETWAKIDLQEFYGSYGDFLYRSGDLIEALNYYKSQEELCREINFDIGLELSLHKQSGLYVSKSEFELAIKKLNELLKFYEESNNNKFLITILENIGSLYMKIGEISGEPLNFDFAIERFKRILEISDPTSNLYINLALSYVDRQGKNDFQKAEELYYKALELDPSNEILKLDIMELEICMGDYFGVLDNYKNWYSSFTLFENKVTASSLVCIALALDGKPYKRFLGPMRENKKFESSWATFPIDKHLKNLIKENYYPDRITEAEKIHQMFKNIIIMP